MGFNQNNAPEYFLRDYARYEDYLDTFVSKKDEYYLRNMHVCRELVALGYRSKSDLYTLKQFEKQQHILHKQTHPKRKTYKPYYSKIHSLDPVLLELAAREIPNYQKIISTIIFLTHRNKKGFEVSGFVDLDASFSRANLELPGRTDWLAVFEERTKFYPKPSDLSYFDKHKGIVRHNDSDNYIVGHDVKYGLNFMHRGDHKKVYVNNRRHDADQNCLRSGVFSPKYGYVIFYDHIIRKKI